MQALHLLTPIHAAVDAGKAILDIYHTDFTVTHKDDDSPLTLADQRSHEIIVNRLNAFDIPVLSEEGNRPPFNKRKNWDVLWIVDPLDGTKEFLNRNGEFTVNIAMVENGKPISGVIYVPVKDHLYFSHQEIGSYKLEKAKERLKNQKETGRDIDDLKRIMAHSSRLPINAMQNRSFTIVGSRSHPSPELEVFVENLRKKHDKIDFLSAGSSLKFCMVAEGCADIYPRFGPTMEWDTAAGQAIAEKAEIPIFTQNSSSWAVALKPWNIPKPPEKIRHWVFKAAIDPIFLDVAIFDILNKVGAKKIAHLNVNNGMGKAMKAAFAASCKGAGFEVVIWESYGRQDTDLTVPLTKIKAKDFDAIVIAGAEMAGAIAYKQAREMGITQPIVGMPPLAMAKIIETLGKSLDGLLIAPFVVDLGEDLPMDDPQRPAVVALTKLVAENTGRKKADTGHTAGWDGIYLCVDALKRAIPDLSDLKKARAQLRDAFATIKGYVGVQSIGDMTKYHEIAAPMIPCELKDGKLQIIGKKIIPSWADLK